MMQDQSTVEEQWNHLFSSFEGKSHELIPVLQKAQEAFGFLSSESLTRVARFLRIPESRVYAVATFYTQFRFKPIGEKHIVVCKGVSCHVQGASRILKEIENRLGLKEGETTKDMEYSLETVACIGACGQSPCMMINEKVEAKMKPKQVIELLDKGGAKKA